MPKGHPGKPQVDVDIVAAFSRLEHQFHELQTKVHKEKKNYEYSTLNALDRDVLEMKEAISRIEFDVRTMKEVRLRQHTAAPGGGRVKRN